MATGSIPTIYRDEETITILVNKRCVTVTAGSANFKAVENALRAKDYEKAMQCIQMRTAIPLLTEGRVQIMDDHTIYVAGIQVQDLLTDRIFAHMEEGFDFLPLVRFLDKTRTNESEDSKKDSYAFLGRCKLPIYPDGDFAAYKVVGPDYYDKFSHTIFYGVGTYPEMPRTRCNPDRRVDCSNGLHVCSEGYITTFLASGDH